jgi:hypothetical protein
VKRDRFEQPVSVFAVFNRGVWPIRIRNPSLSLWWRAAPELAGLAACIATKAQNSGPIVPMEGLVEGVEFRMLLQADPGAPRMLIIEGLLKPDVAGLVESLHHHDDLEAQPAAATRFFHLLRIPVGTRAWVWRPEREAALCSEAAGWIAHLRSRPVLFDRLAPDGEPH